MKRFVGFFGSFTFLIAFFFLLTLYSPVYAEWHFQDSGVNVTLNDVCFVDELHGWAVGDSSTIIKTSNGGETWVKQDCPVDSLGLKKICFINELVGYCIGYGRNTDYNINGVILSTRDGGKTWERIDTGFDFELREIYDLSFADEDTGWVSAVGRGWCDGIIIHTADGGETWKIQYDLVPIAIGCQYFSAIDFVDRNNGWALYWDYHDNFGPTSVLHTNNGGKEWTKISTVGGAKRIIEAVAPDLLWVTRSGLSVSLDGGLTWKRIDQYNLMYQTEHDVHPIDGKRVFVLTKDDKKDVRRIYLTEDGGETFDVVAEIPPTMYLFNMTAVGLKHVWCVGVDGKIIKYTKESTIVEKDKCFHDLIKLEQNFPNPFNPVTKIRFTIPVNMDVTLNIHNTSGQKVMTLIDGLITAGNHQVIFNGSNLASGVYVYRFESENFIKTGKMLIVK